MVLSLKERKKRVFGRVVRSKLTKIGNNCWIMIPAYAKKKFKLKTGCYVEIVVRRG